VDPGWQRHLATFCRALAYPLCIAGRILSIMLTAVFIGLAAAAGGRLRIEAPLPDNCATEVMKKDV
jgi:hypothetical protein